LLAVASVLLLPGISSLPPVDRDESRYAQATRQMLESGNYIDIRFQDEPRYVKPIGIYWLQAASVRLLSGDDYGLIWAYRAPSAIGAIGSVVMTAAIGARLFGAPTGMLAGLILSAGLLLGVEARSAKTDACLLAAILMAQAALARCYLDESEGRPTPVWIARLFWVACVVGVLLKGPVVVLVCGLTAGSLSVYERKLGWLKRTRPLVGVLLVLAIVLPWVIAIAASNRGGSFLESFVWDSVGKAFSGQQSHGAPPGYHLIAYWITFWPFSLLGLAGLVWAWRESADPSIRFCLAWVLPTWIAFEVAANKLPHYVLPTFPAIAMLAARFVTAAAPGSISNLAVRVTRVGSVVYRVLGVGLAAAVFVVSWVLQGAPGFAAAVAAMAFLAATGLGDRFRSGLGVAGVAGICAFAAVAYGVIYPTLLPGLESLWISRRVARLVEENKPCAKSTVYAAGFAEPSLVFLLGTETGLHGPRAAADHLLKDPGCGLALVSSTLEDELRARLATAEGRLQSLGTVTGLNYSKGKMLNLTLYRLESGAM
jgi:4-amino-4-deoxy-L-arabinose transferase-like glycosyltransferase